jgi:hypothetical protein
MTRTPGRRTSTARKSRRTLSDEERAERLAAARHQLLDGIDALMSADGWAQLITSRAWLRRYSLNNVLMILQQCPEATDVRPLSEWKQAGFGYMRKGTHKIKIWKPRFRAVGATDQGGDPTSEATTSASGAPETGTDDTTGKTTLSGFMLVPVVDVSQLQGAPPPAQLDVPAPIELSGDAPVGLWDGIAAHIVEQGYTVERGDCGSAYGRTVFGERRVIVRGDVEPAQAAKTATHELAHILCEHETRHDAASRPLREVEAESVACIVAAVCGLDTLAYSVPYVAGWAADRDTARSSAQRVLTVADTILTRLDRVPCSAVEAEHETPFARTEPLLLCAQA